MMSASAAKWTSNVDQVNIISRNKSYEDSIGLSLEQEDSYILIKVLGRGAFGEAVLYRKSDDNSLVVWKEVDLSRADETERTSALNEVDVLSLMDHVNIISYYNHFIDESTLLIEMEYANGGSLHHMIVSTNALLNEKEVLWNFYQIMSAVIYMHTFGIIHRDIKTLNLFLTKSKLVKLGDFGISKVLEETQAMAQSSVGTPYYMSPEVVRGEKYNQKSDIWACGCVLYELLTLKRVYDASNQLKLAYIILEEQYKDVDIVYSKEIQDLLGQMLCKEASKRIDATTCLQHSVFDGYKLKIDEHLSRLRIPQPLRRSSSVLSSVSSAPVISSLTSEVYCWGGGKFRPMKMDVFKNENAGVQLATGCNHMAVVTVEKELYTWANVQGGTQMVGQLGHNDKAMYRLPKKVQFFVGMPVRSVACGEEFSVVLIDDGRVYTFGSNYNGCIGCGDDAKDMVIPTLVQSLSGISITSISAGDAHVVAMSMDGAVFAWGCGESGRLGIGSEQDTSVPQRVEFNDRYSNIKSLVCGRDNTFFLSSEGNVLGTGSNEFNKLCLNQTFKLISSKKKKGKNTKGVVVHFEVFPVLIRALKEYKVLSIAAGINHSAVIDIYGRLVTFGNNDHGQLGSGDFKQHSSPYLVKGALSGRKVSHASCGDGFTVIATKDNHIYSWGSGANGRLGIDPNALGGKSSTAYPRPIFGSLHRVADIVSRHWLTIALVEQIHGSRMIKSLSSSSSFGEQQSTTFSIAGLSQFESESEGSIESSETQEGNMTSNIASNNQSATPGWLQHELEDAEFIPMATDQEGEEKPSSKNDVVLEDCIDRIRQLQIEIENLKDENSMLRDALAEKSSNK